MPAFSYRRNRGTAFSVTPDGESFIVWFADKDGTVTGLRIGGRTRPGEEVPEAEEVHVLERDDVDINMAPQGEADED